MVKVQHGWQGHNISELEQMTSQQGSPVSAASDRRSDDIYFGQSPARTQPNSNYHNLRMSPKATSPAQSSLQEAMGEPPASATSSQAGTYESFWREHSGTATSRMPPQMAHNKPSSGPTLAPPVDILPGNRLPPSSETAANRRQPARLRTNNLPQPSANAPSTPQRRRPVTGMRTPSQQAAVEKDAVESLLFMSSPGNSAYNPRHHHPPTPALRTPTAAHATTAKPRIMTPTSHRTRYNDPMSNAPSFRSMRSPGTTKPLSECEIDKLLDEMPDDSSDDDDES
ncbi:MAG: hypothetical protein Q9163_000973 [Psora crenata]